MTRSNFSETGQLLQFSFLIQHRVTTTVTSVLFRSYNNTLNSKSQAERLLVDALEQVKDNCQEDSTPRWGENVKPAWQIDLWMIMIDDYKGQRRKTKNNKPQPQNAKPRQFSADGCWKTDPSTLPHGESVQHYFRDLRRRTSLFCWYTLKGLFALEQIFWEKDWFDMWVFIFPFRARSRPSLLFLLFLDCFVSVSYCFCNQLIFFVKLVKMILLFSVCYV